MSPNPTFDLDFATEETYLRAADRQETGPQKGLLTFVVGGESYGLDILEVREIIKPTDITEVPRTPEFLLGILSVRGAIIPVIDLRKRLRLPVAPLGRHARILVAMRGQERYGLLVDAVGGVVRFAEAEIEPAPTTLLGQESSYLLGIGRQGSDEGERIVVLLNLEAVVNFEVGGRRRHVAPADRAFGGAGKEVT